MKKNILLFVTIFISVCTISAQKTHTVKQGETLKSIANEYHVTVDELRNANPNVEMVFSGLLLTIPQARKTNDAVPTETPSIDIVEMRDGSYIQCKVVGIKKGVISIKQVGEDDTFTVMTKDVSIINYANGTKKKFKK